MRGPGARGGGFSLEPSSEMASHWEPWDDWRRNGEFSTKVARVGDLPEPLEPRPPRAHGALGPGLWRCVHTAGVPIQNTTTMGRLFGGETFPR